MSGVEQAVNHYNEKRDALGFFDLNVWWDFTSDKQFIKPVDFTQFKSDLVALYIKRAVITSHEALRYEPVIGNEALSGHIKDSPDLYGCMILVPEIENIEAYIDKKLAERFVSARLFPKIMRHSMKKWLIGDILDHLQRRRVPLILWHSEVSWDLYESLAVEYPDLPIIIDGCETKLLYHNRNYVPLIRKYPNIYLETHNLALAGEIAYLAAEVGHKLIYGSYYPYNTPNASMLNLTTGEISDEIGQLIVSGNLDRLICEIRCDN